MEEAKEIIKRVRKLELKTRKLSEGLMHGAYYSVFKGRGIEFSDVREYQHGDDIRSIDWNVTARMNHPFVKEFVEERNITVMIFFDISASGEFGTQKMLKKEAAFELITSIVFSAVKSHDRVGLVLATSMVEKYLPPRKGRRHALRLVREMVCFRPKEKATELSKPLARLAKIMKRRGVIFIVSDFMQDMSSLEKPMRMLASKHDVIAVRIGDIRESDIPDVGVIELEDSETGEHLTVDTSDPEFRENFSKLVSRRDSEISKFMRRNGIDCINIPSAHEWESPTIRFFKERMGRAP